jgi:hypothetical protein
MAQVIKVVSCIWKISCKNLEQDTDYPEVSYELSQLLQVNIRMVH